MQNDSADAGLASESTGIALQSRCFPALRLYQVTLGAKLRLVRYISFILFYLVIVKITLDNMGENF